MLCSKQRIKSLIFITANIHFFLNLCNFCARIKKYHVRTPFGKDYPRCRHTLPKVMARSKGLDDLGCTLPKVGVMQEKGLGASYDNLNGNENQRGSSLEAPSPVSRPNEYHGRMSVEECQSDGRRRSPALGLPSHSSASSA